jgi:hypothetical protein
MKNPTPPPALIFSNPIHEEEISEVKWSEDFQNNKGRRKVLSPGI